MWYDLSRRMIEALANTNATDADSPLPNLREVAPALSYGRHHGPAPAGVRRAAVAIMWLQRKDRSWWLPLTLRPQTLRHHGGQICFPGGMIESGETPTQAALREFVEELGVAPVDPVYCGDLNPIYVYASNNLVFPVVFTARSPESDWTPDPVEVDRVIELPIATVDSLSGAVRDTRVRQIVRNQAVVGEYRFDSPAYCVDDDRIWGATAMLIQQIGRLIHHSRPQAIRTRLATYPTISVATNSQPVQTSPQSR